MVLLVYLNYLEKEGKLIQGIFFIVAEWKMKKAAWIQALGKFFLVTILSNTTKICVRASLFWELFWKPRFAIILQSLVW